VTRQIGRTIALAGILVLVSAAVSDAAPPTGPRWYEQVGAKWHQASISEPDGTVLHADVLRPADLPEAAKLPVILSIGPYFNHAGEEGPAGVVGGTSVRPVGEAGPSDRFSDFVSGARLMQRGYAFVMVDLRGFGGSTGCLDWGGPGEQADVKAAVEWAASQPWSTGSVGMYGKSYDGTTGLMGVSVQPAGLKAVVAQEPVYSLYNYLFTRGARFLNALATPVLYEAVSSTPGVIGGDDLAYQLATPGRPTCDLQQAPLPTDTDPGTDYWRARDFITASKDHEIPVLLTQGFLEDNTKPEGAWDWFNGLAGPKRGWFGMWDHIRGNEQAAGDNAAPHPWFAEVMRWYDHYVRGLPLADAPVDKDPAVEVQNNDGTWRDEASWPPSDSTGLKTALNTGCYLDSGVGTGTNEGALSLPVTVGQGVWTISPKLTSDAIYSGVAHVEATLSSPAGASTTASVDTYDIDPSGNALLLGRSGGLIGDGHISWDLYGNDWHIPAGHRVGVRVGTIDSEWWMTQLGSLAIVQVTGGTITLPFLKHARPAGRAQKVPTRLGAWKKNAPFPLDAATIASSTSPSFSLPGKLGSPSAIPTPVNPTVKRDRGSAVRLKVRIAGRKVKGGRVRAIAVYGNAPSGWKITVTLQRGKKTVLVKRTTARLAAFRVTFTVRRAGKYRARVAAVKGNAKLKRTTGVKAFK
jgi:predicted acyl esterase